MYVMTGAPQAKFTCARTLFTQFLNLLLYGVLTDRRWVIKMIAGKCADLPEIVERESELVKKIVQV